MRLTNGDEKMIVFDQIDKIPFPGDQLKVAFRFLALTYQFSQAELPRPNLARTKLPETPSKRPEKVYLGFFMSYNE